MQQNLIHSLNSPDPWLYTKHKSTTDEPIDNEDYDRLDVSEMIDNGYYNVFPWPYQKTVITAFGKWTGAVSENMCNRNEEVLMLSLEQASRWFQMLLLCYSAEISNTQR